VRGDCCEGTMLWSSNRSLLRRLVNIVENSIEEAHPQERPTAS